MPRPPLFSLSEDPLDAAALAAGLASPGAGAFVSFEGRVRNDDAGREVVALEYEAYPALCVSVGEAILQESLGGVIAARCVHRVGRLGIGELAVWVGVTAAHRDEAFRACRFIIDAVKSRVPIWKKEWYADGESEWIVPGPGLLG